MSEEVVIGSSAEPELCIIGGEPEGFTQGALRGNQSSKDAADFKKAILAAKEQGISDIDIGARFGVSPRTLEAIITEAYGINISVSPRPVKRAKRWEPANFQMQMSTVWSFKNRGDWATHNGHYRGNWSPFIPRNVILKYSKPGDTVLDYFVGGGTTAVEAKLLGRRCIGRDINPDAVNRTMDNLDFQVPARLFDDRTQIYEPDIGVGDARELVGTGDESVDLICAHPPYADIIKYSTNVPGDLSHLGINSFIEEVARVARESFRVLRPGGKCAILIGDTRKQKHVVPLGFRTIKAFLGAGFVLKELNIKRQHNCKATGFWYARSVEHNFLLLAHEYLPIFEKPTVMRDDKQKSRTSSGLQYSAYHGQLDISDTDGIESTTVWILPKARLEAEIERNARSRFMQRGTACITYNFGEEGITATLDRANDVTLVYVNSPKNLETEVAVKRYQMTLNNIVDEASVLLSSCGYLAVETADLRVDGRFRPMGLLLLEELSKRDDFAIKEIIVIAPDETRMQDATDDIQITHRYLLVFGRMPNTPNQHKCLERVLA